MTFRDRVTSAVDLAMREAVSATESGCDRPLFARLDSITEMGGWGEGVKRYLARIEEEPLLRPCLAAAEGSGWSTLVTMTPPCRRIWEELDHALGEVIRYGEIACGENPLRRGEAVQGIRDQIGQLLATPSAILGGREGCPPIVIDYPFGFGDSCEPKIPLGLWAVAGLWVFGQVKR